MVRGRAPVLDLARERALQELVVALAGRRLIASAHDCAEGGVAITLAECCFEPGAVGVEVDVPAAASDGGIDRLAATLFGESASRVIVSCDPQQTAAVLEAARTAGVPASHIGRTGGADIRIAVDGHVAIACTLAEAETCWSSSIATALKNPDRSMDR
jgi:phosphoribosylformylglycinamidine synthase